MRPALLAALALCAGITASTDSAAETFRCTVDGKVTYSDVPCRTGTQRTVALPDPAVSAADREAAADRARADRAHLAELERRRVEETAEDRRAAAAAARRNTDRSRQARACDKLARAARRAHDDFDLAGPRDQAKARVRMLRADEDFTSFCKARR